jgi:hypothetical protein
MSAEKLSFKSIRDQQMKTFFKKNKQNISSSQTQGYLPVVSPTSDADVGESLEPKCLKTDEATLKVPISEK